MLEKLENYVTSKRLAAGFMLVVLLALPALAENPGHAITFNGLQDGSGSYIQVPDSDAFDMVQPFTIEGWVNWTGDMGYRVFLSKVIADTPGFVVTGYSMVIFDGTACLALQAPGVSRVTCSSAIPAGIWTHVAATYDGQVATIYINGAASNSIDWGSVAFPATDASFGQSTSLLIGREFLNGLVDRTFPGTLDEIRIWNTALSADTIQSWFNRKVSDNHPNVQNLVAYYQFNEGLSKDPNTHDHSGNGHTGTLMNGALRVRSTAPIGD